MADFFFEHEGCVYDTVTRRKLPAGSRPVQSESVHSRLFAPPKIIQLFLIPTWSCNLRCPFCYVLKRLKRDFVANPIDMDALEAFIRRHRERYGWRRGMLTFLGGEPLLNPEVCLEAIEICRIFGIDPLMTTNLSLDLTPERIRVLDSLVNVQVSLDGPEPVHNAQRKVVRDARNPGVDLPNVFRKVVTNLRDAIRAGVSPEKFILNAAVEPEIRDKYKDEFIELIFVLKVLGIKNIKIGVISGSDYYGDEPRFSSMSVRKKPCCCFRYMSFFMVDGNNLSTNYFDDGPQYSLGSLDTPLEVLEDKYRAVILENMPVMQDPACLSCPALGICWGQCFGQGQFKGKTPSQLCHQDFMIGELARLAEDPEFRANFA